MNDDQTTTFIIDIKEKLSSIDAKVDGIKETLQNHENRITAIERETPEKTSKKDELLTFAFKAIIGLVAVVIGLTGSGSLLAKLLK